MLLNKQTAYKRKIYKHLYFSGSLSCADLSELTSKSLPVTTRAINEMIKEGSVVETGFALSRGGRRPQMFSLKHDQAYIVSVAMDQLITRIALIDINNNVVGKVEKIELILPHNPNALKQLTSHISEFLQKTEIDKNKIIGIGIGMPGFVDFKKGINHSFLKNGVENIIEHISSVTGLPVLIDNDSSLIALAEFRLGSARNRQNVMVINIGWGVGLGMIINGELFRGHNGFAGEFSHIPVFTNNKLCSCGKTGCLETETSLLVVVEKAVKSMQSGASTQLKDLSLDFPENAAKKIMDAALQGDKLAVEILSEAAYNIGRGIAILIHLMNPELIVLSGRGSVGGRLWTTPIQQAINELCIPKIADNAELVISSLGYKAELIGAAALVMEHYDTIEPVQEKKVKMNYTT